MVLFGKLPLDAMRHDSAYIHGCWLIIAAVSLSQNRYQNMAYQMNQELQTVFVNAPTGSGGAAFSGLNSQGDLYAWMSGPLTTGLLQIQQNNVKLYTNTSAQQSSFYLSGFR